MIDSRESWILTFSKRMFRPTLVVVLLVLASKPSAAQLECGNSTPVVGCGQLIEVAPDSFVADMSQCLDSKGRDNRGLVIRLDTKPGSRFKCQLATEIGSDSLVAFEPGLYRIEADIEYNRPDDLSQTNESFYIEVAGRDTTGPCGFVNVAERFVVVPDPEDIAQGEGDSVRVVRDLGIFHLQAGKRIFFKHYQILVDPTLTPNPSRQDSSLIRPSEIGPKSFGEIESVHMFRMSVTRVDQDSILTLTKTASKEKVVPGAAVDYELSLVNKSTETVRTLQLIDVLPPQVELTSVTPIPSAIKGDTLIWRMPALAPAETMFFRYNVTVSDTFQTVNLPFPLTNTSTVTSSCGGAVASAQVLVIPECDVDFNVSASADTVLPGEVLNYTINILNTGPRTAFDGKVTAVLPAFVTNFESEPPPTLVTADSIVWTFDSLSVGIPERITYSVLVSDSLSAFPVLIPTSYRLELDCGGNLAQSNVVVVAPPPCDLALEHFAEIDTLVAGENLTYALIFSNAGPAVAVGFEVIATLPDSFRFAEASVTPSAVRNDTLFWQFDTLVVGGIDTISYEVQVPQNLQPLPQNATSTSLITSSCGSDTAFAEVTIIPPPPCDLEITLRSAADTVIVGESLGYSLLLANAGPAVARDLSVVAVFSDSVALVDFSKVPVSIVGSVVSWAFDSLAVGASDSIEFDVQIPPGVTPLPTLLELQVVASSACGADTAALSVLIVPPPPCDLIVTNSIEQDTTIVGDVFELNTGLLNAGPATAFDLTILTVLPDSVSIVTASPEPVVSAGGDTLFWRVDSLATGDSLSFTVQMQTAQNPAMLPRTLEFDTIASAACGSDTSSAFLTIVPPPPCLLDFATIANKDTVIVGSRISYRLAYKNNGPAPAFDVSVFTTLPDSVSLIMARPEPADFSSGDTLFWHFDSLAIGEADSIVYEVEVSKALQPLPQSLQSFSGIASACGAATDSSAVIAVSPPPCIINLDVVTSTDSVIVGDNVSFTLLLSNKGPAVAFELALFSVLPDSGRLISASPEPAAVHGDTLFWTYDSLAVGASDSVTYLVQISKNLSPLPQVLESLCAVRSECGADSALARLVAIPPLPCDLELTSSAAVDSVIVGEVVTARLHLSNGGPAAAFNVEIVTILPDSVEFLGASVAEIDVDARRFLWKIDSLAAGAGDSITYQFRVAKTFRPVPRTLQLLSTATSECGADSTVAQVLVLPPPPCLLDLSVSTASDTVFAGDSFGYTLQINNSGPAGAPDLAVFATLPDSSDFVGASITPAISADGDTLFWQLDSLSAGSATTLEFSVSLVSSFLTSPLQLSSTSGVSAACGGDTVTTFVTAIDTTIQCSLLPSLSADADTVKPGSAVNYTLAIENGGPDEAGGLVATQVLPAGISLLNSSPPAESRGDTLLWRFSSLGPGLTQTLTFAVLVDENLSPLPRLLSGPVMVSSDCDTATALLSLYVSPFAYDLRLTKTVDPQIIDQNDILTYSLRIDNLGPDDATDVLLVDVLPDSFEVVQFLGQIPDSSDHFLRWEFPLIVAGGSVEVVFTAVFDPTQPLPGTAVTIGNVAFVSSMFDNNPPNDTSGVFVNFQPDLKNCQELFRFDRNVFEPEKGQSLEISFEIDSQNRVTLDLYDITGYRVTNMFEGNFNLGPNTFLWNGKTLAGTRVGSGVYIVIFRTRDANGRLVECIHKLIVAR